MPESFASAVAIFANLHFIASIPNGELFELDQTPNPLREELVTKPLKIDREGYVRLPEGPGLGLELNKETIEKYQVREVL